MQQQLWSYEHDYLHSIGSPGLRWVMVGFYDSVMEARAALNERMVAHDMNNVIQYVIHDFKIVEVKVNS